MSEIIVNAVGVVIIGYTIQQILINPFGASVFIGIFTLFAFNEMLEIEI